MKRFFSILLLFVALFTLTSCFGGVEPKLRGFVMEEFKDKIYENLEPEKIIVKEVRYVDMAYVYENTKMEGVAYYMHLIIDEEEFFISVEALKIEEVEEFGLLHEYETKIEMFEDMDDSYEFLIANIEFEKENGAEIKVTKGKVSAKLIEKLLNK